MTNGTPPDADSDRQPRSYTTWNRLEPLHRDREMEETLRAEIADPAWLLSRQHQLGEFEGDDGGSPVAVDLDYAIDRASGVRLEAEKGTGYDPVDDGPLEALVERERVLTDDPPNARLRAETGMNFLSRLRSERRATGSPAQQLPTAADFPDFLLDMEDELLDGAGRRFALVMDDRVLDGYAVFDRLRTQLPTVVGASGPGAVTWADADPSELPRSASGALDSDTAYKRAVVDYVSWYTDLFDEPDEATGAAWDDVHLEYSFDVGTGASDTETVLEATEYPGGRLDWEAFSVDDDPTPIGRGDPDDTTAPPTETKVPTAVTFRGMPASRYWELEDANVNVAEIEAAPEDFSRLALVEMALVGGDEWFSVPLLVDVGSLVRFQSVSIRDTFGTEITLPATESETDEFSMFNLDVPGHPGAAVFVPPTLGTTLNGDTVERITFTRDEVANLAFAIEETVEGPLGDPLDRDEFDRPALTVATVNPAAVSDEEYVEFENEGDDVLDLDGYSVVVEWSGGSTPVHTFSNAEIPPQGSLRVVTGGRTEDDTAEEIHLEETAPVWNAHTDGSVTVYPASGSTPVIVERIEEHDATDPVYRIATDVLDHWFPLQPEQSGANEYRFETALLLDADTLDETVNAVPQPLGRILDPDVSVDETAITRAGTEVSRAFDLAEWHDGRTHVWSGRRRGVGRGEASSGLRFDFLDEPDG
jgi:hypothetical protein